MSTSNPIVFVPGPKSISDDDICSDCTYCKYAPGELSTCEMGWPGEADEDGYIQSCSVKVGISL